MRAIIGYIKLYFREINFWKWLLASGWIALLVYLNYTWDLEGRIYQWEALPLAGYTAPFLVYALAYYPPLVLVIFPIVKKQSAAVSILLLLAPALFAVKVGLSTYVDFSTSREWELYWNKVLYWPLRMLPLLLLLWLCCRPFGRPTELLGLSARDWSWKPYAWMLLIMIPLISIASTQADFLHSYPRIRQILPLPADANPDWLYSLLYELGYGTDFISIEVFFRGLLVVGFSRWLGRDAILPMACFYCSIHFGKPLGECISSYFGGTLLGIVSYHSRSIYGGLMVHLGIAWLMELGGYLGNTLKG